LLEMQYLHYSQEQLLLKF